MDRIRWRASLPALAVMVVTLIAYWPALNGGYVWDDSGLIVKNRDVRADDGLLRVWFHRKSLEALPLTYGMHWLEWRIFNGSPAGPHVINVLLHGLSAVLLGLVLRRLRVPGAWLAALFFALHPVAVASGAWLSERKNTLSMVFYLGSILAFLRFEERSSAGRTSTRWWYALSVGLFLLALLSKTSVVMLPVVLLLLAWWQRGRLEKGDLLRTVPFFALSLALGLVTVWFQWHNAIAAAVVRPEGAASRIAAAGWIVWFYLAKVLLPIRLWVIYPRWDVDGSRLLSFVPLVLLAAGTILLWIERKRWGAGPLVAWACFLVSLLPVLGFVDMAFMGLSLVADHLQYVAMPAVLALAAALVARATAGAKLKRAATVLVGICLAAMAALTFQRAGVFSSAQRLWGDQVAKSPRSAPAWCNLGNANLDAGDPDEAIRDYDRAIAAVPKYANAWYYRGMAYAKAGRSEEALRDLNQAIALQQDDAEAHYNRGNIHLDAQRYADAIRDYDQAIARNPDYAEALYNRANACMAAGRPAEAIRDYSRAIELRPQDQDAWYNRAVAHSRMNQNSEALADFRMVRELGGTAPEELLRSLGAAAQPAR